MSERQPAAWAVFAEGGNIRMWSTINADVEAFAASIGAACEPLFRGCEVSDERALDLAHQICTGKLSAIQGAVEIMEYATDVAATELATADHIALQDLTVEYTALKGLSRVSAWVTREEGDRVKRGAVMRHSQSQRGN